MVSLNVHSIFPSIDGEVNLSGQGCMTTFIRLQGCNLMCPYCDTKEAQREEKGKDVSVQDIVAEVLNTGIRKVTITGGEPMMQAAPLLVLLNELHQYNIMVSMETNGSIMIPSYFLPLITCIVMDFKLPSSEAYDRMRSGNFTSLRRQDFIKFVVQDEEDYKTAIDMYRSIYGRDGCIAQTAFSLVNPNPFISYRQLFDRLMHEGIKMVYFNTQLHKLIDMR